MLSENTVPRPSPELFFELARSPEVTILAGPNEEAFKFPRDLLSYYSPFFKACFNGNFKEGKEGILRLPEDNPDYIRLLSLYMVDPCASVPLKGDLEEQLIFYLELIKFADKYDIPRLTDVTMHHLKPYFAPGAASRVKHIGYICLNVQPEVLTSCLELLPSQDRLLKVIASQCLLALHDSPGVSLRQLDRAAVQAIVGMSDPLALAMMRLLAASLRSPPSNDGQVSEQESHLTFRFRIHSLV